MANLEVQIGADSGGFMSEIAKVEKELAKLKSQQASNIKLGLDTSTINKQIADTTTKLNGLKNSLGSTTTAFNNNSRATANGASTLTQFSRIAQDAPFGIIGIGNNLTATAESFTYLAKSSGGAGNALKAVGASLLGPGGVLLAISLVTTGLTVMAQQGLTISDVFNKLTGNFSGFANSLKEASREATISAIEETGALKGLIAIAQSEAQSKKMRLEAVDQLQKMYPNYFGNLSKEEIMYSDLTSVVNDVTKALINKAIAEKMSEKAAEPTLKLWEANARLIKQRDEAAKAEAAYQKAASNPAAANSMQFYASASQRATQRLQETRNEVIALNKEVAKYENLIKTASQSASKVILKPGASAKPQAQPQVRTNPVIENNLSPAGLIDTSAKGAAMIKTNLDIAKQNLATGLSEMDLIANQLIEGSMADTFGKLGEVIGNALATGGNVLQAVGSSLMQSLGGLLSAMGDKLIQLGTAAILAGTVVKLFGTISGIGAGLAAVAGGVILKGIGGAIASKGNQNTNTSTNNSQRGSFSSGADVSSPQSSVSSGGTFNTGSGTVVFEISGQKLIGVLSNTLGANQRLGGNLAIG